MKVFKFDVNESFAKANNELLRDSNRLRVSGLLFGLILIIAGAAVWWSFSWGVTVGLGLIFFGIVVAFVGLAAASKVGTAQSLYDSYPLAPAVIAEVNERDMVLLARKSIPQEQWQRLERARKRLSDVKATRYDLLVL